MNKAEFLANLQKELHGLPQEDIKERLSFYSEMIDDRVEEGMTEENAVAQIGSVEDVVSQIMSEIPLSRLVKEKMKPKRAFRAWEIILLILGSPIWLSILIAVIAVVLSVYIAVWAAVVSLYAVTFALAVCVFAGLIGAVFYIINGNMAGAGCYCGAGIVCAGLAILLFFGCIWITKGVLKLTNKALMSIKSWFVKKEAAK